jgi:hypothetical protein
MKAFICLVLVTLTLVNNKLRSETCSLERRDITLSRMLNAAELDDSLVAAWTFDSPNENCEYVDISRNRIVLKRGGEANNLQTGEEDVNSNAETRISYLDFSRGDAILYGDPTILDNYISSGSFTMIAIFNAMGNEDRGAFIAGQWEEYDRARTFALFGSLFNSHLTAHSSLSGKASPPICDFAKERANHNNVIDYCWHTAALVWNSNPNAINYRNKENLFDCDDPQGSGESIYQCDPNYSQCSAIQVYLDDFQPNTSYYKYKNLYIGSYPFDNHPQVDPSILRKALFTVGGTATKHCKQPDSGASDVSVNKSLFGNQAFTDYTYQVNCKTGYTSCDWAEDFIPNQDDYFVRSRFRGKIAGIFFFGKAMNADEIRNYTFYSTECHK